MGRPTRLTAALSKRVADTLASGCYVQTACQLHSVAPSSFYQWLGRAAEGEEPYFSFAREVRAASARAEMNALEQVRRGAESWQAHAFFLARRWRERWGGISMEVR